MTRVLLTADCPIPPELLKAVLKAEAITITFPGGMPMHVKGASLIPPHIRKVDTIEELEEFLEDAENEEEVSVRQVECLHMAVPNRQVAVALMSWIESLKAQH